jgi:hypothetical protein
MVTAVLLSQDRSRANSAAGPRRPVGPGRAHCGRAAPDLVLPDQLDLPLSRPVIGSAAVRPCLGARCRLAAHRLGGARLRLLAPAVADHPSGNQPSAHGARCSRRGTGGDELAVLPRGGPPAALDSRGDRVPRHDRAGRRRHPHPAQRPCSRAGSGRGVRAHRRATVRAPAGFRVRLRQLPRLHGLRRARSPRGHDQAGRHRTRPARYLTERHRPARRRDACRRNRRHPVRADGRAAGTHAPGVAGLGCRRRCLLLGDPLRHRPAGHGPDAPSDLRADARAATGRRDRDRSGRPRPGAHRDRPGRDRAGHRRRRRPPRHAITNPALLLPVTRFGRIFRRREQQVVRNP